MDNVTSFRRFFGTDPNIALHGSTPAEWGIGTQEVAKDAVSSPMADNRISEVRLGMVRGGSDRTRLGSPLRSEVNPYTGPQMTLVLSRNAVSKLGGTVLQDLRAVVAETDSPNQKLQDFSLQRVASMRELIDRTNQWAIRIQGLSLPGRKG